MRRQVKKVPQKNCWNYTFIDSWGVTDKETGEGDQDT